MEYENVLLIGGPRDGEWLTVLKGAPTIRMAQLSPAQYSTYRRGEVPSASVANDFEYRRVLFQSDRGFKGAVFVLGDIDPMVALIEGYRKP